MTCNEELTEENYGSVIIDLRDIKADGTNDITKLAIKMQNVFSTVANRKLKIILQDNANMEVATGFICGLFLWGMQITVDDTLKFMNAIHPSNKYEEDSTEPVRIFSMNDEFKESIIKTLGLLLYGQ